MQKYSEANLKFVDYYSTAGREQKKIDFIRKNEAFAADRFRTTYFGHLFQDGSLWLGRFR